MASCTSLLICGTLLTILIVSTRSAPIEKAKDSAPLPSINSNRENDEKGSSSVKPTEENKNQKKRQTDDDDLDEFLNGLSDDDEKSDEHSVQPEMKETSGEIHDNGHHSVDIDDSNVFSDLKMNPFELKTIGRNRRDLHLNKQENRRRKRATFSPYELYETEDPRLEFFDEDTNVRPSRSFAPIYWFPTVNKRNFGPSRDFALDEPAEWTPENFDDEQIPNSFVDDEDEDEDEDQNQDEYNRYPILLDLTRNPFDNLQLQQNYNGVEIPVDDEENENFDDDEQLEQYPIAYGPENPYETYNQPNENYFYF